MRGGLVLVKITTKSASTTPHAAIVSAATQLFGEKSYPATSMRDIANAVGVLSGSLYTHIRSKEALLLEIVETGIGEFIDAVSEVAGANGTPEGRLRAMVNAHSEVVARHPEQTLIVFHQWRYLSEAAQTAVRRRRKEYEQLFTDVVRAGVEDGTFAPGIDVRIAVLSVLGSLNWTPGWLSADGPRTVDEVASDLADAMLKGVRGR